MRLMAVHAHPDDESSKGAATLARYADEGHRVLVVTLTGGERGDILNPAMDLPEVHGHIAEIRRDEMAKAAEILGVEHTWLGFVDSGLPQGDPPPPLPEGCFALVPLDESDQCCGSAGIYNLIEPETSDLVLERKLDRIGASHATLVATGNPGCLMQIGAGLLRADMRARVVHPIDLLDASYAAD